ncbi:hypothetical protein [Mesorhizobium sp. 10J20-29]
MPTRKNFNILLFSQALFVPSTAIVPQELGSILNVVAAIKPKPAANAFASGSFRNILLPAAVE